MTPTSSIAGPSSKKDTAPDHGFDQLVPTLQSLTAYCRQSNWAGWDPYDGLNSRLFQGLPFFRHNKLCRLAFIQLMKRSPVNLRPLLLVPPGRNPKGTALFATTLAKLSTLGLADLAEARGLVDSLIERRCPNQRHACWGYHFDWQTRGVLVPSTLPNIVCTSFVAHAFLDLYDATGHVPYREMAESAGRFITSELAADLPDDAFCIRYFTIARSSVHNASLLGAALLARLFGYTKDRQLEPYVMKAARYSLDRQRADGSWPYGENPSQAWIDSFHTGYNLLALKEIGRHFDVPGMRDVIQRGLDFYMGHFFREDGAVRYFHDKTYPVDAHAVGHAFVTLAEFSAELPGALDQARASLNWATKNLRSPKGYFYYQYRPWFTNRISYIRWSQAWMLYGLAALASALPRN